MTLLDHFHPPLSLLRHWHAFYNAWATYLASDLNRLLPERYFAEPNVQFGIEVNVDAFEETGGRPDRAPAAPKETGRTAVATWTAPAPTRTVPLTVLEKSVEVRVFSQEGGPALAAALELVSPANKDRPASREAFVSKCAAYLQQGVALVVVDIVTDRNADLHQELLARVSSSQSEAAETGLYAAAYRPVERSQKAQLEIWRESVQIGRKLPVLPLWLPGNLCLPVDLASSYERTCQEQRIPGPA